MFDKHHINPNIDFGMVSLRFSLLFVVVVKAIHSNHIPFVFFLYILCCFEIPILVVEVTGVIPLIGFDCFLS